MPNNIVPIGAKEVVVLTTEIMDLIEARTNNSSFALSALTSATVNLIIQIGVVNGLPAAYQTFTHWVNQFKQVWPDIRQEIEEPMA